MISPVVHCFQLLEFKRRYNDSLGTAERAVDQAIETTTANIAWLESYYDTIFKYIVRTGLVDRHENSLMIIILLYYLIFLHFLLNLPRV